MTIELNISQLAREHCAVDALPSVVPRFAAYTEPKMPGKQPWPVIGHDPVQSYLQELRVSPVTFKQFSYSGKNWGYRSAKRSEGCLKMLGTPGTKTVPKCQEYYYGFPSLEKVGDVVFHIPALLHTFLLIIIIIIL